MAAKQVVYRFNGEPKNDKVVQDLDDEIKGPAKDSVIGIDGKDWKVVMVTMTHSLDARGPIPVMTIYLTDN
jgi:hypothetical protein